MATYEKAIYIPDQADGHLTLQHEVAETVALKAVLYGNAAQCLLSLELFRGAVAAASTCLELDDGHAKALHRHSEAYEAIRQYDKALEDAWVSTIKPCPTRKAYAFFPVPLGWWPRSPLGERRLAR